MRQSMRGEGPNPIALVGAATPKSIEGDHKVSCPHSYLRGPEGLLFPTWITPSAIFSGFVPVKSIGLRLPLLTAALAMLPEGVGVVIQTIQGALH